MPDITMCENFECPLRKICYRYRAVPSDYQSFSFFTPQIRQSSEFGAYWCDYFWDVRGIEYKSLPWEEVDEKYKRIPRIVKMAKEKQDD